MMRKGIKVTLDPTPRQARLLASNAGAARFVFNLGLMHVKSQLNGLTSCEGKGKADWSMPALRRWWNEWKQEPAPWWRENSKEAYTSGLQSLANAFANYFAWRDGEREGDRMGWPKPRSKHKTTPKFTYTTGSFGVADPYGLKLPRVGRVHCMENVGKLTGGIRPSRMTISRHNGRWFASLLVERPDVPLNPNGGPSVGIDLGVKTLVTLSDGTTYANPRTVRKCERRRRRIQRQLARKTNGSKRRDRCRMRLVMAYAHERNVRMDYLDKMTTDIAKRYGMVCIEDLNVSGMVKNHRIAKHIEDASFSTIRRMLEYKCPKYGSELRVIDRYFPSSKRCSNCGLVKAKLGLGERTFACERCGLEVDRDLNAATNILVAGSAPETLNAHGADVRPDVDDGGLTAVKCEPSVCESDVRLGADVRKEVM